MQEVVEVDLPIPLRVRRDREVDASDLARDVFLQKPAIGVAGFGAEPLPAFHRFLVDLRRGPSLPALLVRSTLERELLRVGPIKEKRHQGVPGGQLVDRGGPVPDPLPRHEHGHRAVELELHHLGRRRVSVPTQVSDKTPRLRYLPGAESVTDACRALDVFVRAHVVDQGDETVIKYRKISTENLFGGGDRGAFGVHTGFGGSGCPGIYNPCQPSRPHGSMKSSGSTPSPSATRVM